MVTKEDVKKAKAAAKAAEATYEDAAEVKQYFVEAHAKADAAAAAAAAKVEDAWDKYWKLKRQLKMVTKEQVDKAYAEYKAADAAFLDESKASHYLDWVAKNKAWDKYWKLKREYEKA